MEPPNFCDNKTSHGGTFRNYVFTLNNYTETEIQRLERYPEEVRFVAYSKEVGESGTPHLQGYVVYWQAVRFTKAKQFLRRAHFEVMHGTLAQSEQYCSKQSSLIKHGDEPAQGRRTDIITVKRKIDEGATVMDIMEDESCFNTCLRNERSLSKYQNHVQMKKRRKLGRVVPEVHIRVGPTRSGKTTYVYKRHGYENVYNVMDHTGDWFDGYNGESVVLFDDVRSGSIPPVPLFLRITEGDPINVPIKGGSVLWQPKYIYFTSNELPLEWWPKINNINWNAVEARIWTLTKVYLSKDPVVEYKNKFHYGTQEEEIDAQVQQNTSNEEAQGCVESTDQTCVATATIASDGSQAE